MRRLLMELLPPCIRRRHRHHRRNLCASTRLAEGKDAVGVATEHRYIVAHPSERDDLIEQRLRIAHQAVALARDLRERAGRDPRPPGPGSPALRNRLALVTRAEALATVWSLDRAGHLEERDLPDAHAVEERDGQVGDVRQLEREVARRGEHPLRGQVEVRGPPSEARAMVKVIRSEYRCSRIGVIEVAEDGRSGTEFRS